MNDGKLISEYFKERQGRELLEKENGFIFYKINGEECFIAEMFVRKEVRGGFLFKKMIEELSEVARSQGCMVVTATVHLWDSGKDHSIMSALKLGFKIIKADQGVILLCKEL